MNFDLPSESTTAIRRQLNADLPIHTLSAELLIEILIDASDIYNAYLPTSNLHTLAQVCSYWFRSILANPRFWRVIDARESDFIPTTLLRNPNGPLVIRHDNVAANVNDFLEAVSDHAGRWETLTLRSALDSKTLEILRRHPMPALKALTVRDADLYERAKSFPISEAPALEFISVVNASMPWDSPSLSRLRCLSICDLAYNFPSLHQLVAILIASPALEWFALDDFGSKMEDEYDDDADEDEDEEDEEDTSDLPNIISLPELRGLVLEEALPISTLQYLASSIYAPQCHTL